MKLQVMLVTSVISMLAADCVWADGLSSKTVDMLTEAFRKHRIANELTQTQMDEMASRLDRLEATPCVIDAIVGELRTDRYQFATLRQQLEDKIKVQEQIARDVYDRLIKKIDAKDVEAQTEIKRLALKVAGMEHSRQYTEEEVIPFLETQIESQRKDFDVVKAAVRIAGIQYEKQFKSLCDRVTALERRFKPPIGEPELAPTLPPVESLASQRFHPNHITNDRKQYCTKQLLATCYNYYSRDNAGTVEKYHGDVYRSCSGEIIMVTHVESQTVR